MIRSRGYVKTLEIAAPVEPAIACPTAGRAGPPKTE